MGFTPFNCLSAPYLLNSLNDLTLLLQFISGVWRNDIISYKEVLQPHDITDYNTGAWIYEYLLRRNQNVGDANLCQNSGFMVIIILNYYCSIQEYHITCMSFWILNKTKKKDINFPCLAFHHWISRTVRFEVQHKHAFKSKTNPNLHLLPNVYTFMWHGFKFWCSVSFVSQYILMTLIMGRRMADILRTQNHLEHMAKVR